MTEEETVKAKSEKSGKAAATSESVVLIGRKPVMNYVVACLTCFNSGEKDIFVKARGRAISTAVDAVELLRRGFAGDVNVNSISIGTEEVQREEGRTSHVSTIEINLVKP